MKSKKWLFRPLAVATVLAGTGALAWQTGVIDLVHGPLRAVGPNLADAASTEVTVSIPKGSTGKGAQAYGQNPLQVDVGTTVTWVNDDTIAHTVTSDVDGQFNSGNLDPGKSFKHTFSSTGSYAYY